MGRTAVNRIGAKRRSGQDGQDAVWKVLRQGQRLTVAATAAAAVVPNRTARSYLERLARAGIVARWATVPVTYSLLRDSGPEAPRINIAGRAVKGSSARQQLWNALKVAKRGTAEDLARLASSGADVVTVDPADARHYLAYLKRAGYLAVAAGGTGGVKGRSVYTLIRDTGPDAPMIQRVRAVYDPNERRVVWAGGQVGGDHD